MADDEKAKLRHTIEQLTDATLRSHMLRALEQSETEMVGQQPAQNQDQDQDQIHDPIRDILQHVQLRVQRARDALLLAVHLVVMEHGFSIVNQVATTSDETNRIPSRWDQHAAEGLFNCSYRHPHDLSLPVALQALFVGPQLVVYLSNEKQRTTSHLELEADLFLKHPSAFPAAAELCLRNLTRLREKMKLFVQSFVPDAPKRVDVVVGRRDQEQQQEQSSERSRLRIPPVGRPDAFPLGPSGDGHGGSGDDPGMLVGPDHPLFGRRYDPTAGPIPGARFDPFGPPGFGPPPPRGPAPRVPFGDPNPDHLRMPRDDDDFDGGMGMGMGMGAPFGSGFGGGRRGGGGGRGGGGSGFLF